MSAWLLTPLGRRLLAAAIVAAAIAAVLWGIYNTGRDDALSQVEKDNADASDAALQARLERARCRLAGGLWDFGAGECRGP